MTQMSLTDHVRMAAEAVKDADAVPIAAGAGMGVDSGLPDFRDVSLGHGPLVVMIHGFPDYWLTWRHQMEALAPDYRVIAIDQRGYNLSDKQRSVGSTAPTLSSNL
jgi:pimeloyl-ACP methyl ester carboxylesterase